MSQESAVLDPVEFIPESVELDLHSLGLEVRSEGVDWGESTIEAQMVRKAEGEESSDGHRPGVPIRIPLRVREDGGVSLAEAAHRLEVMVGSWQERGGWIRRDFSDEGGFTGSVGYRILRHTAALSGLQGWLFAHRQDAPDVILTATRWPVGYSTQETESAKFSTTTERHLLYTLPASEGTAPGLRSIRVTNENATEDLRGLIWAEECIDAPADLEDPTAALAYEAQKLTPMGGALVTTVAPDVRAVGVVASGVGAISPGLPAGTVEGDLLIMVAESGGATASTEANTALTAAGWSSPPAPYAAQKKGNTRLTILYKIAAGADATTTNDTGDHQVAQIVGVKAGTFDLAAPFNVSAVGTQVLTKAVSIPGATTTRDNCLVLACASGHLPDAATTTEFGAATNASLASLTERIDTTVTAGDGGALYAVSGVKATKGVYSATTCTAVTEAERGVISLAINPPMVVQHSGLTAGWLAVLGSEISGVGHMTHRGPRRPWMRIFDPGEVPGGVELQLLWRALGSGRWSGKADNPIVPTPVVDDWQLVDLGECRPQRPILGDERWEWKLLARAPSGSGTIRLQDFYPLPTEQYAVLREPYEAPTADAQVTKSPGTVANVAGGNPDWELPNNVKAADGSSATVSLEVSQTSDRLKVTDFGFTIPTDATIIGFVVPLLIKREGGSAISIMAEPVKGGVVDTTFAHLRAAYPTSAFSTISLGSANDLWGNPWTPADVNSSGFGFALRGRVEGGSSGKILLDHAPVGVYYTEAAEEDKVCFAARSVDLSSVGSARQDPTEDVWGHLTPDGFLPYDPPGGPEARQSRGIVIPTRGDLGELADAGTCKVSAVVGRRSAHHFVRGAA